MVSIIAYHSPEYDAMLKLRYKVLRKPLGLTFSPEDLQNEANDIFIADIENGEVKGCCILTRKDSHTIKLRQMAIRTELQGLGIGKRIITFAEQYAQQNGYHRIILNARTTAKAFYEKCGYHIVGGIFTEVGISHILMEKIFSFHGDN